MHDPLLDPITFDRSTGKFVDSSYPLLSDAELELVEEAFVRAARWAYQIGCQFVDIKTMPSLSAQRIAGGTVTTGAIWRGFRKSHSPGPQHYYADSARSTTVADFYPAKRFMTGCLIVGRRAILTVPVKPWPFSLPVLSAWGTSPLDPQQPDLEEPIRWIEQMRQLGVAVVNISMGNPYASPHLTRPFEYPPPDGYETPEPPLVGVARHFRLTEAVQRTFPDLVVVGSGYSYLQEFLFQAAAGNVARGRVSIVGVGRAALAQPDFVRQLVQKWRSRPSPCLSHFQLLHSTDAFQAPSTGTISYRMPRLLTKKSMAQSGNRPSVSDAPTRTAPLSESVNWAG
jgi:NADPH2 dehydrogenase